MTAATARERAGAAGEPRHGLRIFLIWLPAALVGDLLIWFVWGPHMPPGAMASASQSQQFDINVLALGAWPVMAFLFSYAGYAFIVWRHRPGDDEDGPAMHGNARASATWIAGSTAIVLGAFVFGTVQLILPAGAGAGEGNTPIWRPGGGTPVQVQVIGQQWRFTYRYPQYGGFETTQLVLPVGQNIQFNVTSLDVIHDFWAYQLGVKADANPQVNNVAYTKPLHRGRFIVRCDELCGLWHGAMFNGGSVVSVAAFRSWAAGTEARMAPVTRTLPSYALTYAPNAIKGLAKFFYQAGVPGAGASYYGPQYPVEP